MCANVQLDVQASPHTTRSQHLHLQLCQEHSHAEKARTIDHFQLTLPPLLPADGSLTLNEAELVRPENTYEDFALITASIVRKIATFYDVSASDVLAVCAMAAPRVLNPDVDLFKYEHLRVGKIDSAVANPAGMHACRNATSCVGKQGLPSCNDDSWSAPRMRFVAQRALCAGTFAFFDVRALLVCALKALLMLYGNMESASHLAWNMHSFLQLDCWGCAMWGFMSTLNS
jgi:hypothetical protein